MDRIFLVAGGRKFQNRAVVWRALDEHLQRQGHLSGHAYAQGGCPTGVDLLVREWASNRGLPCITVHPAWDCYGKQAGPVRNSWMLRLLLPAELLAFPGENGTRDCIEQATRVGVPVLRYDADGNRVEGAQHQGIVEPAQG
jgi:hypothetical protein